jgi:hypothetical protein
MTDAERAPVPSQADPVYRHGLAPGQASASPSQAESGVEQIADAVVEKINDKVAAPPGQRPDIPPVDQAIALREQAPELYDLWLKIAEQKAATANYVDRAPYEVPERLAHAGRPRALGALVLVLSFCGYLAWLGGPGPYIAGLIAILDLVIMFGIFSGLRPERLPGEHPADLARPGRRRRLLAASRRRTHRRCRSARRQAAGRRSRAHREARHAFC